MEDGGIRQCGMYYGESYKNDNQLVGQFLLFPVWILLMITFWNIAFTPLLEWSRNFQEYNGGLGRMLLGWAVEFAIVFLVLYIWVSLIIPHLFKKAGNYPLYVMTIGLWWVMVKIGYNWTHANFQGIGYIIMLILGGLMALACIINFLSWITETRCDMCHNCSAQQTGHTDDGISYKTSYSWSDSDSSRIRPRHSGALVTNARKLVRTTSARHNWRLEHTCPNCGNKWNSRHSENAGRSSQVVRKKWEEHY